MSIASARPDRRLRAAPQAARDHSGCAHDPAHAADGGLVLTAGRQRILDELCAVGRPLGAYDLMDRLADPSGKRPAPISVYRALDFLVEKGLVHRLASRNAFLACAHGHGAREPVVFLICDSCGGVTEAASAGVSANLSQMARSKGFESRAHVIELTGRCETCRKAA